MEKLKTIMDNSGNKIVLIPDDLFQTKKIDWKKVENYLGKYVGDIIKISETKDVIFIGKKFPDEYAGSKYTRSAKGARAKAKANAVQGIHEMVEIATDKTFRENRKEKHNSDAEKGWYYYTTRFAVPIYDNEKNTGKYNIYKACLVVNHTARGRMYLYDLVDIKKEEASNPLKTSK